MLDPGDIGRWISENESFLSGMVALIVPTSVVLSPIGKGLRGLYRRFGQSSGSSTPREREAEESLVALAGSPPSLPAKTPPTAQTEPLLAVLAFDNLSNDAEMQFFSDGVTEEIIQRLSRGASFRVIGRTSSFQFRGDRKAEAAGVLRCSHILDGSIRRAADRVRISAHLVDADSRTTLWSDRYDSRLEDIFAVKDEISESIATALDQAFSGFSTPSIDPAVHDLYLSARPRSYSPDELRKHVALLEAVTRQAPEFADAWGRLAYLRAWLHFYQPYSDRAVAAAHVAGEAGRALELDPGNADALTAQLFVITPFGRFIEGNLAVERLRQALGPAQGNFYIGWYLRTMGFIREGLEEAERAYRLDALDPMAANTVALARMAAGRLEEARPVYEDLLPRVPDMSFPLSSLLRLCAFQQDWAAVDRLTDIAEQRQLREFQETLPFIRAKRNPTPENIGSWKRSVEAHLGKTGGVDVSRLVYAAHLGLVEFWMTTGNWPDCADEVPYDFRLECDRVKHVPKEDSGF